MRKATIIILGLLVSISAAAQQQAGTPTHVSTNAANASVGLPTVDAVLEKYVSAVGGRAAIEKINSRVSKGTFELASMAGVKGTVEIYEKAPDRQAAFFNIPGIGMEAEGFDGTTAWELEPDSGVAHEKSGLELASARRDAEFYSELKFKEMYPRTTLKGVEKVGASDAYVIEAAPTEGSAEHFYFDTATGLLLRHDSVEEGDGGKKSVEEYYSDYRMVDGVKVPFALRQKSPGMELIIKLAEVKQNVAIEDTKFNRPE
ncbi:MAG: hypothetical protein M3362_09355 [Acidobacteriota bacterium]|nr:hypothetical protein [Acidobacteriota bacterium]